MDLRSDQAYEFHASSYDPPLGFSALDFNLTDDSTHPSASVAHGVFSVANETGLHLVHLHHPYAGQPSLRIAASPFRLDPRREDPIEGYCFGGSLALVNRGEYTSCHLSSSAPIFELSGEINDPLDMLAPEIGAELARQRGHWKGTDSEFAARMAQIDPFQLFVASLQLLHRYLDRQNGLAGPDETLRTKTLVARAIRTLEHAGQWPASAPEFDDLFR